ncbi:MAG: CHAT domain-containing protein [Symploca sp. SIO1C2]|nr:CHAT domain-containing protein [Symploca sp. SIO1C2]
MEKILILTANPKNTDKLRLDEEVREIQVSLELAKKREQFEVVSRWALRVDDLPRALLAHEPKIVHFSGHGAGENGLAVENSSGQIQLVSTESLAGLFELFKDKIDCVVLNACYSETQAEAIHQHIDCVVGMNKAIGDRAAIKFAVGFYDALGAGKSYTDAYKFGCNAIRLEGISESLTPVIKIREQPEQSKDVSITQTEVISPVEPIALLNLLKALLPSQFENVVFLYDVDPAYLSLGTAQAQRATEVVRYAKQQEGAALTRLSKVIYEVAPHLLRS